MERKKIQGHEDTPPKQGLIASTPGPDDIQAHNEREALTGSRGLADWIAGLTARGQCRHPQKMMVALAPDCLDIYAYHLRGFNLKEDLFIGLNEQNTQWARDLLWNRIAINRNQLEVKITSAPPNDIYRLPQISIVIKISREHMNILSTQKRCDIRYVHYYKDKLVAVEARPLGSINVLSAAEADTNQKVRLKT